MFFLCDCFIYLFLQFSASNELDSSLHGNINTELGMTRVVASLITSIPVWCMDIFSLIAIKVARKWGMEQIIDFFLLIIRVGIAIGMFTHSSSILLITDFIAGLGIVINRISIDWFHQIHFPIYYVQFMITIYQ